MYIYPEDTYSHIIYFSLSKREHHDTSAYGRRENQNTRRAPFEFCNPLKQLVYLGIPTYIPVRTPNGIHTTKTYPAFMALQPTSKRVPTRQQSSKSGVSFVHA